jgi:hypothetical protein
LENAVLPVDYARTSIMDALAVKERTYPSMNVLFSIALRIKILNTV